MLKEHEALICQKDEEMFHKQEQSILALISVNNSLMKQRLDSLSKDINDLKENLEIFQNEYEDKFKNLCDRVQRPEEDMNQMKEELCVTQTTKP